MTTPVKRARLTDEQLRPNRPAVEIVVPDPGVLGWVRRAVQVSLRRRVAEPGHTIRLYRMKGQRDINLETLGAFQEVIKMLDRFQAAETILPEDWALFVLMAKEVIFHDDVPAEIALRIPLLDWMEHLSFFGRMYREDPAAASLTRSLQITLP